MRRLTLLILPLLMVALITACARPKPAANPFSRSATALDPALEKNWPSNWATSSQTNTIFASFVHHAEGDKDWLLLGLKGEAVYVSAKNPDQISVTWQGRSNKVDKIKIPGECEALSLRQYARGKNLVFDSADARLTMDNTIVRKNSGF